ncbi:MAG: hypothetical protein KKD77_20485 [Gammaproteobacteria bacterium]|nr:hypothetical protein [Gammaproteobacteria bacterium]
MNEKELKAKVEETCRQMITASAYNNLDDKAFDAYIESILSIGFEISERYAEIAAKRCSQGVFELDIPEPKPVSRALPDIDNYSSWVQADGKPWVTPETRI